MQFILFLICSLFINPICAKVIDYEMDSFADIANLYEGVRSEPRSTLLVFDLDDTLITMTQPLGSVGWWDWQSELQKTGKDPEKLFTADYQQLVRIQNILFQLIKMEVTDKYVLPFLNNATAQGTIIMGLTARGKEHLSATMMQLRDNNFTVGDKLLFQEKGLKFKNNKTSIADSFHCPQFSKEVIYQRGIMFLDGEDKGQALLCALSKIKTEIKTIIFVDDAKRNSASIDKAFANHNDLLVLNILYTKENAKELEIQSIPLLQQQLFEQWSQIKNHLNDSIVQSNF
ncbi:DUF2608 domain-containing protein [Legionella longbeachae]|uniref:DUF2608 domain-containing protein n=1 Tax=Legionella longbeachae serogroup 1 (strain NSW150) TaxID=661367 RepID=D3HLX2_LEGLN|nr:DUF2608 domain-containing protein [Legionella longbeachae]VEE03881.1 HAD phosphatase, family IIIC [Legionella oakridgensis]HBD7397337.1 DUF2608 domain-containing protein [Legionella pneumophila]ARB93261.1 DUF2608 domain-containing protein [Legionella longbeachae]ARM33675.1 DUF2608 domain-containing protein [Legionella longbeachae]EEZ93390.1 conserved hypothetical protein [Legionella longbeachae D-4968]